VGWARISGERCKATQTEGRSTAEDYSDSISGWGWDPNLGNWDRKLSGSESDIGIENG